MKNLIFCGLVPILILAACKKESKITPPVTTKTNQVVFPSDSVSYTIDGKNYILTTTSGTTSGYTDADRKIDSIVHGNEYYVSGRKDSVFYFRSFDYRSDTAPGYVELSFFRKYSLNEVNKIVLNGPLDGATLFKPGNYVYGTDFMRQNATNGVAIGVNAMGATYSNQVLGIPSPITPASESNAHFQIVSLKLVSDQYPGQYVLEAKFDATLFDGNGSTKQLTNGYARINVMAPKE